MGTFEELKRSETSKILSELHIFCPTELDVYLFLLTHNPASVLQVSKGIKGYRANVYEALKRLTEKGFVRESVEDNKRFFFALKPENIKQFLHQKQLDFEKILPSLSEVASVANIPEQATITWGTFAFRSALNDFLKLGKTIQVYGIPTAAVTTLGEGFLDEFHKQRIKKKIKMYHLYNRNADERIKRIKKMKYTQVRHLSSKYDSNVATNICGDTVFLVIFNNPVLIVTIKNAEIAKSYSRYFEILWERASSKSS